MSFGSDSGVELLTFINPVPGKGESDTEALFDAIYQNAARDSGAVVLRHMLRVGEELNFDLTDTAGVEVSIQVLYDGVVYDEKPTSERGLSDRTLAPEIRAANAELPLHGVYDQDLVPDEQSGFLVSVTPHLLVRNVAATPDISDLFESA